MFGPLLEMATGPLAFCRRLLRNRHDFMQWWSYVQYSRACNFFDGRQPPLYKRLKAFGGAIVPAVTDIGEESGSSEWISEMGHIPPSHS